MKSGNFNFLELSGSLQACNGTAFFTCFKKRKKHICKLLNMYGSDVEQAETDAYRFGIKRNCLRNGRVRSFFIHVYKKAFVKTECGNYTGISVLLITYKILSYILLLRLTPYAEEIVGDYYMWISTLLVNY